MSVVSVILAISIQSCNSEGQIQCLIQLANKSSLLHPRRCLSFHRFMFSIQNNFCKKGGGGEVIVVIGVLHGMKVKCQLLRRIFFFLFCLLACCMA